MSDPSWSSTYRLFWTITPSDTVGVRGPTQSDGRPLSYCDGFLARTSGNVTALAADGRGQPPETFAVVADTIYPIGLSWVYTTTTADLMALKR